MLGGRCHQESQLLFLCVPLLARLLTRSPEYVALVRRTQTLDKEELQALSKQFDAVYFHPVRASVHTQIYVHMPMCIHTHVCPSAHVFLFMLVTIPWHVLFAIVLALSCSVVGGLQFGTSRSGCRLNCTLTPQNTFHCARLAVGAALQLVDAVLTGAVHNGLALVR